MRLLLTLALLLPALAMSERAAAEDMSLSVKPVLCITDKRNPSCDMAFLVVWQSALTGYYCLFNDFDDAPVRDTVMASLDSAGIESRPVWKPMHLQPVFRHCDCEGGDVSEELFHRGLCLPSGSALTDEQLAWIAREVREALGLR